MDTALAAWLRGQLKQHDINARTVALNTGLGPATLSHILRDGHIPRIDTLNRLADHFDVPRENVLRIAAGLPEPAPENDDYLIDELTEAFRQLPDDWKEDALAQVRSLVRLTQAQAPRILGAAPADDPHQLEEQQGRGEENNSLAPGGDRSSVTQIPDRGQPEGQQGRGEGENPTEKAATAA